MARDVGTTWWPLAAQHIPPKYQNGQRLCPHQGFCVAKVQMRQRFARPINHVGFDVQFLITFNVHNLLLGVKAHEKPDSKLEAR